MYITNGLHVTSSLGDAGCKFLKSPLTVNRMQNCLYSMRYLMATTTTQSAFMS